MSNDRILGLLRMMAVEKARMDGAKKEFAACMEVLRSSDAWKEAERVRDDADNLYAELRTMLEEEAMADFKRTGDKKLTGGVWIRVLRDLRYDEAKAKAWAETQMRAYLILNRKPFEKWAKDGTNYLSVPGAELVEVPTVTVPTNLTAFLVSDPELESGEADDDLIVPELVEDEPF